MSLSHWLAKNDALTKRCFNFNCINKPNLSPCNYSILRFVFVSFEIFNMHKHTTQFCLATTFGNDEDWDDHLEKFRPKVTSLIANLKNLATIGRTQLEPTKITLTCLREWLPTTKCRWNDKRREITFFEELWVTVSLLSIKRPTAFKKSFLT